MPNPSALPIEFAIGDYIIPEYGLTVAYIFVYMNQQLWNNWINRNFYIDFRIKKVVNLVVNYFNTQVKNLNYKTNVKYWELENDVVYSR